MRCPNYLDDFHMTYFTLVFYLTIATFLRFDEYHRWVINHTTIIFGHFLRSILLSKLKMVVNRAASIQDWLLITHLQYVLFHGKTPPYASIRLKVSFAVNNKCRATFLNSHWADDIF